MKNYWLDSEEVIKDEKDEKEVSNETSLGYTVIWAGHKIEIPN